MSAKTAKENSKHASSKFALKMEVLLLSNNA